MNDRKIPEIVEQNVKKCLKMPRNTCMLKTPPKKRRHQNTDSIEITKDIQEPRSKMKTKFRTGITENKQVNKQETQCLPSMDSDVKYAYQRRTSIIDLAKLHGKLRIRLDKRIRGRFNKLLPINENNVNLTVGSTFTTNSSVETPMIEKPQGFERSDNSPALPKKFTCDKLSILEIPEEYLDDSCANDCGNCNSSKIDLDELDHQMIEWILQHQYDFSSDDSGVLNAD